MSFSDSVKDQGISLDPLPHCPFLSTLAQFLWLIHFKLVQWCATDGPVDVQFSSESNTDKNAAK